MGDADGGDDGCIDIVGISLGLCVGLFEIEGASVGCSEGERHFFNIFLKEKCVEGGKRPKSNRMF